jgi:hypothetical protein
MIDDKGSMLLLPRHIQRQRRALPDWVRECPNTYARWRRLGQALALIQQELPRSDQRAKLAALVELAFMLGREAEQEIASEPP